jgi:hypothetical protein
MILLKKQGKVSKKIKKKSRTRCQSFFDLLDRKNIGIGKA